MSIQAHTGLNLTKNQKDQGYILCQNSLKEYKCGCKTIQYNKPKQNQIKPTQKQTKQKHNKQHNQHKSKTKQTKQTNKAKTKQTK